MKVEKYSKSQKKDGYEVLEDGDSRRQQNMDRFMQMYDEPESERDPGGFLDRPGMKIDGQRRYRDDV